MNLKKSSTSRDFATSVPISRLANIEEEKNSEDDASINKTHHLVDDNTPVIYNETGGEVIIEQSLYSGTDRKPSRSWTLVDSKNTGTREQRSFHRSSNMRVSYFNQGKPKDEEDILKMESPFYRIDKSTIIKNVMTSYDNQRAKTHREESEIGSTVVERRGAIKINTENKLEVRHFKSLMMTILQIVNCIIRYTLIQFPFCIKTLGLFYGPLIISIVAVMSIASIYMLISVKLITGEK
jgi:hypothetical protein